MYRKLKYKIDFILALILLPLFLLLIFLISFYIFFVDGLPVFYITQRIGEKGKIFRMYKLRTMRRNAEKDLEEILKDEVYKEQWMKYKKLKPDPRLIKGGFCIRKHSLDELPQIFNILKGEMSFIGPRPYLKEEIDDNFPKEILNIRPGLTGLWQVSGRNNLSFDERIKLDLFYVKNLNFFLDLKIFLKTFREIFFSSSAF